MKTLIVSILTLVTTAFLSSCNNCNDLGCSSYFLGGGVTLKGHNLQQIDTVWYVKYNKGDFQNPLDSFVVRPRIGHLGNTPDCVAVSLSGKFDINNDWKIVVPPNTAYYLTNIQVFAKECSKCTFGYTYFDEYEVKVNGEMQRGYVVLTK